MGIKLTMVHKPCMAIWLFKNNPLPLVLNVACHPKNLASSVLHYKKESASLTRDLKEIIALKPVGNAACAVGFISPKRSAAW